MIFQNKGNPPRRKQKKEIFKNNGKQKAGIFDFEKQRKVQEAETIKGQFEKQRKTERIRRNQQKKIFLENNGNMRPDLRKSEIGSRSAGKKSFEKYRKFSGKPIDNS